MRKTAIEIICGKAFLRKDDFNILNGIIPGKIMVFCSRNTDFYLNMQVLKLLSRVAFICNVCFLLASLILLFPNPPQGHIISSVIVAGYLMGLPANVIVFGWVIVLASSGRRQEAELPTWLMVVNGIIFSFQLVLLILHFWT